MAGGQRASLVGAAVTMAVDHVTEEVVAAFGAARVSCVLLKGPSIARWLYPDGGRSYGDTDLLVHPDEFARAAHVLASLGFSSPVRAPGDHASTYQRAGASAYPHCVDLHRTLPYVTSRPIEVWRAMAGSGETVRLGRMDVEILGVPQRCLHVAMHALQHAFEARGPFEDLRRAVAVAPIEHWAEASAIGRALGAEDALAAGLCLIPEGQDLAERLDLTAQRRGIVRISASPRGEGPAFQLQRAFEGGTLRERMKLVVRPLVISPAALRQVSPVARRGRTGLVLAYTARPFVLLRRLAPALASRRRILRSG